MTIALIIISLVLFYWNFQQQKAIRALRGDYNKVCNVLADELNVEDVKKRLEGITTKQLTLSEKDEKINNFPLTFKQLKLLRKEARKDRYLGTSHDAESAEKWLLPVVFKMFNTGYIYYKDEETVWLISNNNSDELIKYGNKLGNNATWQIILDSSQIKELLK